MQFVIIFLSSWLALIFVLLWLLTRIRYQVGPRHLKIRLLGLTIRRVRLDNIKYISTVPTWFGEKWHNSLFPSYHRMLCIRKRRGLIKNLIITPHHRYVIKSQIERARAELGLPGARPGETEFFAREKKPAGTPPSDLGVTADSGQTAKSD